MLKLCIYVYLCFCSKLVKYNVVDELLMNSLLIVVFVVIRCCCWWLKLWVIIIIELVVKLCCSWGVFIKMGQMVIFVKMMFWFKFYMVLSLFGIKFGLRGFKVGILGWKMGFSQELPVIARHGKWFARGASCTVTTSPISRSCVLFIHFCFELAFNVNMKVLDNYISFSVALVWFENEFNILSYFENTPSRSWRNFKETWHNYFQVNPKLLVGFKTSKLEC